MVYIFYSIKFGYLTDGHGSFHSVAITFKQHLFEAKVAILHHNVFVAILTSGPMQLASLKEVIKEAIDLRGADGEGDPGPRRVVGDR